MKQEFTTERLELKPLSVDNHEFIRELVNTPGWLRFIGNRNVNNEEDARNYIQRILNNPDIQYWVVSSKEDGEALGLVTLIKRDYLEHHDIGFAFLPEHNKKGYAYEAAKVVLDELIKNPAHPYILATTLPDNVTSIQLLEKLGLGFDKQIEYENEPLLLYSIKGA